jgi:hypothetical protein
MGTLTAYSLVSNPYRFDAPGKISSSISLTIRRLRILLCSIASRGGSSTDKNKHNKFK